MSNICFTVLHHRTPFLHALSIELEKRGHNVFFLCPSPKWRDWLTAHGTKSCRILDQTASISSDPLSAAEFATLLDINEAERKSDLTLNSIILMDRLIREWDSTQATNYLIRLFELIKNFLKTNQISMVIGEATPANELLTSIVCDQIGIPYHFPITVRIPDSRFAFFAGRLHRDFALRNNINADDRLVAKEWAEGYLSTFKMRKPKPSYWHKNNKLPKLKARWIYSFFKTIIEEIKYKNSDPTRFNLTWLLRTRTLEVYNRYCINRVAFHEISSDERFVLYPLHKQPESSVDVLGDYYSDQLNLIRQICRSLPAGYTLLVKEHSNAIGDRPLRFYREVSKLPNTKLISPTTDSFQLLQRAAVVVTISGTMAYEAGLLDRPAITFSDMFFSDLPSVRYCSSVRELPTIINDLIRFTPQPQDEARKLTFLANLYINTFEGTFSDVDAYPEVLAEENIKNVCNAIEAINQ